MLLVMYDEEPKLQRCKFCSVDYMYSYYWDYNEQSVLFEGKKVFKSNNKYGWYHKEIKEHFDYSHGFEDKEFCNDCYTLNIILQPDEVYGQLWDVKKVLENSHLNSAQQKVYLKYGLISPRLAVAKDSTLTLEDLNYREDLNYKEDLKLIDAIPTGCFLVPLIILGLMILNDSWFIKFLGISGIGGFFYWLHQKEKAEKEKT